MQKKFYIEIDNDFDESLANLNDAFPRMNEEAQDVIMDFMNDLGFVYDIGTCEFIRIDDGVQSVWDIRKYGKKLITQKDFYKFVEEKTPFSLEDFSEDELDEAIEVIAQHPDYGKRLHQPDDILVTGVTILDSILDDNDEDDCCYDENYEACQNCRDRKCEGDCDNDEDDDDNHSGHVVVVHVKTTTAPVEIDDKPEELKPKKDEKKPDKSEPEKKMTEKKADTGKKVAEDSSKADVLETIVALLKDILE